MALIAYKKEILSFQKKHLPQRYGNLNDTELESYLLHVKGTDTKTLYFLVSLFLRNLKALPYEDQDDQALLMLGFEKDDSEPVGFTIQNTNLETLFMRTYRGDLVSHGLLDFCIQTVKTTDTEPVNLAIYNPEKFEICRK